MKTVEIYFKDLNPEKQKELLDAVGMSDPKEMNWDGYFCPLTILDFEDGDYCV